MKNIDWCSKCKAKIAQFESGLCEACETGNDLESELEAHYSLGCLGLIGICFCIFLGILFFLINLLQNLK
jgi:hypothetical protein